MIDQTGFAPSYAVPFEMYVVLDPGPLRVESLGARLEIPPGIFVLGSTILDPRFEFGDRSDPFELVLRASDTCVDPPRTTAVVRLTLVWLDYFGHAEALDFSAPLHYDVAGEGARTRDCDLVVHALAFGDPLPLFYELEGAAVVATLQARRDAGTVRLCWSTNEQICATGVRVLRSTNDGPFDQIDRLTAGTDCVGAEWTDTDAPVDATLRYRVEIESASGTLVTDEVLVAPDPGPARLRSRLLANIPNPFNPRTEIRYELARSGEVVLEILDVAGRRVRTFALGSREAGTGSVVWTGEDDRGASVASGVYHVVLKTGGSSDRRRIVLVR